LIDLTDQKTNIEKPVQVQKTKSKSPKKPNPRIQKNKESNKSLKKPDRKTNVQRIQSRSEINE
jgi:hypothetical protein